MATLDLPTIDLVPYLTWLASAQSGAAPDAAVLAEAQKASEGLHKYGLLIVRDPRASESDNDVFLDMMEAYFEQPEEAKNVDVRKELYYQVGTTPSRVELPRNQLSGRGVWRCF